MTPDLEKIIKYIVAKSAALKDHYTNAKTALVEFACIFTHSDDEYQKLDAEIRTFGKIAQDTPTGYTYLLNEPLETVAGKLQLVKVRKPDPIRQERGDADFNTDYKNFKKRYGSDPKFELIDRGDFEMLRITDKNFDALACFSNVPMHDRLGITF